MSGHAARILCVMGVAGCGKSTIGAALAARLGAVFIESDAHHPPQNIAKMSAGVPLTDADRWPWLDALGAAVPQKGRAVFACSALRHAYRTRLATAAGEAIFFLHLAGSKETIANRMSGRDGHFMPLTLLDSQFDTLEPLLADETGVTLDVTDPPENLINRAIAALKEMT